MAEQPASKLILGSGLSIFLIGAIFWAGTTYNRIEGIEKVLINIQVQLSKLGDLQVIGERGLDNQRRLEKLEDAGQGRR